MILTKEQLHDALVERHGADIQAKLDKACVGIAGLGGLAPTLRFFWRGWVSVISSSWISMWWTSPTSTDSITR